jgi:hypothetical protein
MSSTILKILRHPLVATASIASVAGCLSDATGGPSTDPRGPSSSLSEEAHSSSHGAAQHEDGEDAAQDVADRAERRSAACKADPRVLLGLVSFETCVGADIFFRETFGGNGRTCESCHPVAHNFTLDEDFIAKLPPSDPLFVAETNPALGGLEKPDLMRRFGLITVNADGFEDPTHKFVMRSVPHVFSMATTITPPPSNDGGKHAIDHTSLPPNHRTGWSGDGAPGKGELRDFTDGAVTQHFTRSLARVPGVDFVLPTDAERDAITTFMMNLGRKNELDLTNVHLADEGAERGRESFVGGAGRECNDCHHNAGANIVVTDDVTHVSLLGNFTLGVGTELARLSILNDLKIPFDGGFGVRPFSTHGDGVIDAFGNGGFNVPPLIEAADTAPFFHTNAFAQIEDAIRFYTSTEFGTSRSGAPSSERPHGGPFVLSDGDIADLGRFLRVLNAAFNCQLSAARLKAAADIAGAYHGRHAKVERGLFELARVEIVDALNDLERVADLGEDVQEELRRALRMINEGARSGHEIRRARAASEAFERVSRANDALGSGMVFQIGEGTLMF